MPPPAPPIGPSPPNWFLIGIFISVFLFIFVTPLVLRIIASRKMKMEGKTKERGKKE